VPVPQTDTGRRGELSANVAIAETVGGTAGPLLDEKEPDSELTAWSSKPGSSYETKVLAHPERAHASGKSRK